MFVNKYLSSHNMCWVQILGSEDRGEHDSSSTYIEYSSENTDKPVIKYYAMYDKFYKINTWGKESNGMFS